MGGANHPARRSTSQEYRCLFGDRIPVQRDAQLLVRQKLFESEARGIHVTGMGFMVRLHRAIGVIGIVDIIVSAPSDIMYGITVVEDRGTINGNIKLDSISPYDICTTPLAIFQIHCSRLTCLTGFPSSSSLLKTSAGLYELSAPRPVFRRTGRRGQHYSQQVWSIGCGERKQVSMYLWLQSCR